jgi:hypothetical protein
MPIKKSLARFGGPFLVGALFVGSVVCGSIGWKQYIGDSMPLTWTDIAYRLLTLFTINASFDEPNVPLLLDVARFLAPLALASTVVFVMIGFFRTRLTAFAVRSLWRGHAIFYGCNPRSLLVASDIVKTRRVAFVPNTDEPVPDGVSEMGAVALSRAVSPKAAFRQSSLARASVLFVMCESDVASQSVSRAAEELLESRRRRPRAAIFAEYSDDFSLRVAREQGEARAAKKTASMDYVAVHPFNLELQLAREIIDGCQPGLDSLDRPFHTAIFGFDRLGQALAFEAVQMFHFPDLRRPRLTVVDRDIGGKLAGFLLRHPGFDRVADIRAVEAHEWLRELESDRPSLALVCFPDPALAFDTGRALRQISLAVPPSDPGRTATSLKIVVVPPVGSSGTFPESECRADFDAINGIDVVETDSVLNGIDIINREERRDAVAKGIHYGWTAKPGEAWDPAAIDAEWARLSDTLRDSNRYAARHLFVKLDYLGWKAIAADANSTGGANSGRGANGAGDAFDIAAIDGARLETLVRLEHNRWVAEKYLAGYMPTACADPDEYRKQKRDNHLHGDLVPWESLSRDTRLKDSDALRFANEIVACAGLRLVRAR